MHVPGKHPHGTGYHPHRAMPQRNPWAKVGPSWRPPTRECEPSHTCTTPGPAGRTAKRDRVGMRLTCSPLAHCVDRLSHPNETRDCFVGRTPKAPSSAQRWRLRGARVEQAVPRPTAPKPAFILLRKTAVYRPEVTPKARTSDRSWHVAV